MYVPVYGVALRPVKDMEAYREKLQTLVYASGTTMKPKVKTVTMILRIFCAMVFLSVGFAHRMPAAIASDALSVAYSLPDGSFADLCIADSGQKHASPVADCEACRLAGAILLPGMRSPTPAARIMAFIRRHSSPGER